VVSRLRAAGAHAQRHQVSVRGPEKYKLIKSGGKYVADPKSIDMVFQHAAEVVLDSGKCYIFPENHRRIMHEVLMDGGYRFTRTEMANADGPASNTWWLSVKQVGKP
jgi:hypothetical protein